MNLWILAGFAALLVGGFVPMRLIGLRRESGMFVALVVLALVLFYDNPDFLNNSNISNTLRQISMLGILAIGIGFVIVTGGIDLSIGSIAGLTGVVVAKLCAAPDGGGMGYSLWVGIPAAMTIAVLIGVIQGSLITRLGLQPFIVTLGFMLTLRGVSQVITENGTISLNSSPLLNLANGGLWKIGTYAMIPYTLIIFLIVVVIAGYVLHFSVFGRYIYAIGGNRDAAEYSGINVKKVETIAYVISAFLASVAGVCYASYISQMSQQVGIAYELYAIAAAVLGGISLRGGEGSIVGIVIGTAIMRTIYNGINMFQVIYTDERGIPRYWKIQPEWELVIVGFVILLAVVLDQLVHIVQAKRRIRRAGAAANAPPAQGFEVVARPAE